MKVFVGYYNTKDILNKLKDGMPGPKIEKTNPKTGLLYDTVTDENDESKRCMYATFSNSQQYAEYLIEYSK